MSLVSDMCSVEEVCIAFGGSEKLLIELRGKLEEWLKLQPHLPRDTPKEKLEWFILNNKMSLERVKRKLDMYYTIRRLIPEFFESRDPCGPALASIHDVVQGVILPRFAYGKYRTFVIRCIEADTRRFNIWMLCKYMFMVGDIRMMEDLCVGENYVFDLSTISLGHVTKLTPTFLKKFQVACLNGYGSRIEGVYLINAPPIVDRLVALSKPFVHPKIMARFHVFTPGNLESFYQFIPKHILPKDYGGEEPTMAELSSSLRKKVEKLQGWFLEHGESLIDERLRPGAAVNADSLFGFSGSFRKLEVD